MDKLAIQLTTALLLFLQLRKLDWPWWGVAGALVVGTIVVHLVYDFVYALLFGRGSRHLGAAAVSNDDPLMVAAIAEALSTWPRFLELYREYPKDSLVKFRLKVASGEVENVWGDLLELAGDTATTYLRTPPVGKVDLPSRRLSIPVADIIDWQVMVEDGTLRGGFTQQATFRIMEREGGPLPAKLAGELRRYQPLQERPATAGSAASAATLEGGTTPPAAS